jgi:hypothetical protein
MEEKGPAVLAAKSFTCASFIAIEILSGCNGDLAITTAQDHQFCFTKMLSISPPESQDMRGRLPIIPGLGN